MNNRLWIGLGGGIGALLRYGVMQILPQTPLPIDIFAINIVGSFAIAVIMTAVAEFGIPAERLRLFLTVGVLGGFTTFSTFALGTYLLIDQGNLMGAYTYSIGSLFFGLTAAWSGIIVIRALVNRRSTLASAADEFQEEEGTE